MNAKIKVCMVSESFNFKYTEEAGDNAELVEVLVKLANSVEEYNLSISCESGLKYCEICANKQIIELVSVKDETMSDIMKNVLSLDKFIGKPLGIVVEPVLNVFKAFLFHDKLNL